MIKYISSWAEQVIIAVIVATILEMILPKGNSKKYIKTIIGVYILYTIISPAIKIVNGGELKIDYSKYEKYFNTIEASSGINGVSVEDTYKTEIEKQMKKDIESLGYSVKKISANFDINEGIINSVTLTVDKRSAKEETESNNINISINKIEIGSKYEENNLSSKEIEEVKQKIKEDYGVDYKNITVNSI